MNSAVLGFSVCSAVNFALAFFAACNWGGGSGNAVLGAVFSIFAIINWKDQQ